MKSLDVDATVRARRSLTASFNGQIYGVRAETSYRHVLTSAVGVTPYAALQSQWFHPPNHSETDLTNAASGFALACNGMTANDTRSEIDARFDDRTMISGMPLVLRARLAWAHDWVSIRRSRPPSPGCQARHSSCSARH